MCNYFSNLNCVCIVRKVSVNIKKDELHTDCTLAFEKASNLLDFYGHVSGKLHQNSTGYNSILSIFHEKLLFEPRIFRRNIDSDASI